jgi:hypothetical protein
MEGAGLMPVAEEECPSEEVEEEYLLGEVEVSLWSRMAEEGVGLLEVEVEALSLIGGGLEVLVKEVSA